MCKGASKLSATMASEKRGDAEPQEHRNHRRHPETDRAPAQRAADPCVPHGDVGSGHEHDERESQVREEREGLVRGVHQPEPGPPDHEAGHELPEHQRQMPFPGQREERAEQGHEHHQRQRRKSHGATVGRRTRPPPKQ